MRARVAGAPEGRTRPGQVVVLFVLYLFWTWIVEDW
jgi:hypothetical protein